METIWTPHRFSGEVLALDVANTVVLRVDPARTFDRFDDPAEIERFAAAASGFRAAEIGGNILAVSDPRVAKARIVALREATDALFRDATITGVVRSERLAPLLECCAGALAASPVVIAGDRAGPAAGQGRIELEAAVAISALSLLQPDMRRRIRICGNCGWLFLDKSRNGSRLWCDMSVCGNRQKARRHYRRARDVTGKRTDA
ncbi:MAG: CGNR zinc finger domain-containing protein [Mesorhizobium sp.]|nr:CGNR zinc finger domain-containing protein [Mesorhizobium sp.]MCO5162402.1 CGNR zinc finger domain-containing protein [Mesorhizobium sp.]